MTFTNVHHIVAWKPGGRTDLPNLVLLCKHHHGVVHRKGWTMSGDANEELTIVSPTGGVMVSRPSPLWTRMAAGQRGVGRSGQPR
jgi:predicted restriction endonuclease